jgi:hypothetical protein
MSLKNSKTWSVKKKQCIKQLKHFNNYVEMTKFILSLLRQSRDLIDIQHDLKNYWDLKIANNIHWNNSICEEKFRDWISNIKQVIINSFFKKNEIANMTNNETKKVK